MRDRHPISISSSPDNETQSVVDKPKPKFGKILRVSIGYRSGDTHDERTEYKVTGGKVSKKIIKSGFSRKGYNIIEFRPKTRTASILITYWTDNYRQDRQVVRLFRDYKKRRKVVKLL